MSRDPRDSPWSAGLCGIVGIAGTLIPAIRHRWTMKEVAQEVLPSLVSLTGALAIFVVAGDGPSTWFQCCATWAAQPPRGVT